MSKTYYDLIRDLVHHGKSEKRFINAMDIKDFPNLEAVGVVSDFETMGSA